MTCMNYSNCMKKFLLIYSLLNVLFVLSVSGNEDEDSEKALGFVNLFNGKDLTNWVDVNTSPNTW